MSDAPPLDSAREGHATALRRMREDFPIYVIAGGLLATCIAVLAGKGIYLRPEIIPFNAQLYSLSAAVIVTLEGIWLLFRHRPARPIGFLGGRWLGATETRSRLVGSLPLLAILMVLMPFFSELKSTIPLFNAYGWDHPFIAWDRMLFFGNDPWRVLQPLLGYPLVPSLLSVLYHAWLIACYLGSAWFVLGPVESSVRRRFMLSFVLGWSVVGGAMATMLASYGPCFVGEFLKDGTFNEQMAYLRAANQHFPVMTLEVQDMLAARFHEDVRGLGSGISAMPSMHVAIAFLLWLGLRAALPRLAWYGFAFFVAIWAGSIHLAYHYALDGLISVIAMAAIWKLSGMLFDWWDRLKAAPATARPQEVGAAA